MDTKEMLGAWDHLRQCHGIARRAIAAIPADKIHSHPIPNMRTPTELVVHLYGSSLREMAEGVKRGKIEEPDEAGLVGRIKTREDLLRFVDESWTAASRTVSALTDTQLKATVPTPWNVSAPGHRFIGAIHDEFLHHRGQLFVYLRALGEAPPEMWDFEHNAPEFQPKSHART